MAGTIWIALHILTVKYTIFEPPFWAVFFLLFMKYRRLSKEQFLELHEEFARFLATQQITVKEWDTIKNDHPAMAEDELNIFSDIVWEDVLSKTNYLEHISKNHLNLFKCDSQKISRIFIQLQDDQKNFLNEKDFNWFLENPLHESLEYFTASKKYQKERNAELFELIEKGSQITKGALFKSLSEIIPR